MYKCPHCTVVTSNQSNLKTHVLIEHGNLRGEDQGFMIATKLSRHVCKFVIPVEWQEKRLNAYGTDHSDYRVTKLACECGEEKGR